MDDVLKRYLPERSVEPCLELIRTCGVHLKIVKSRQTRHGDYRRLPGGGHLITVNASHNRYRFLITLIHELAHLVAFERYGRQIKPHGREWKYTFRDLMLPLLRPDIFPERLLPHLARHFRNPKASSSTDTALALALKSYDPDAGEQQYVFQLPEGATFRLYNGRIFRKGPRKIKRYQCLEVATGKLYLFQPHAEVELLTRN
ncbi:SprT-like domain-containing protein [Robiginitalea sp. SC105]|uniref:SprT-like domain-containing protein n=1 Tax=Robiginitalea sp. SC105 TaxID=2762332 RepID=UPI00163A1511|nr:SprT-like domain-containing protein [Robiginitalea sp. SC105]MBC2839580.1 SprT-like domain-containing protein [Robiginitalea sp. SC105]